MTNIINLFNFIESNRPEYRVPLKFKLIYEPESITEDDLYVDDDLDFSNTQITTLPDNLTVDGTLDLSNTPITSIPDNLTVMWILDLYNTSITSLPDNLIVEGDLDLRETPLSKKYSEDEIRKMIQDKGGNVEGNIYLE